MSEDYHVRQIKELESEKTKLQAFLTVVVIALIVFAGLYFTTNTRANQESTIVDTCTNAIGDFQSAFSDLSSKFDDIDSTAQNAQGEDYDAQYDALSDVSSSASDGKSAADDQSSKTTDCAQPVADDSSSND